MFSGFRYTVSVQALDRETLYEFESFIVLFMFPRLWHVWVLFFSFFLFSFSFFFFSFMARLGPLHVSPPLARLGATHSQKCSLQLLHIENALGH